MKQSKLSQQIATVLPAEGIKPVVGLDLGAAQAALSAAVKIKGSKRPRVIVKDGKDFAALGAEMAEVWLGNEADYGEAKVQLAQQANATRGTIWLAVAMQCSDGDQMEEVRKAFKSALESKGHKRAAADASDFKTFGLAYLKAPEEVIGALAESPNYHEAMAALRDIKNDGQTKSRKNARGKTLTDKGLKMMREQIARANLKQLDQIHKACLSRAKALRAAGEKFDFLK